MIVGDGLSYISNSTFSTPDQDNRKSGNCTTVYRSGGWFNGCYNANPNGQYTVAGEKGGYQYISWVQWKTFPIPLKTMQLMIRPQA